MCSNPRAFRRKAQSGFDPSDEWVTRSTHQLLPREERGSSEGRPELNSTPLSLDGSCAVAGPRPLYLDGWPSGLRRTIGNRVGSRPRGFESHPVRCFERYAQWAEWMVELEVRNHAAFRRKEQRGFDPSDEWKTRSTHAVLPREERGREAPQLNPTPSVVLSDTPNGPSGWSSIEGRSRYPSVSGCGSVR